MIPRRKVSGTIACVLIMAVVPAVRADQSADCRDAFESGQKDAQVGKLLDARRELESCAVPTCGQNLPKDCRSALETVLKRIPSIVASAVEGDAPLSAIAVTMDGAPLANGIAVEVDPGDHVFMFTTSDGRTKTVQQMVVEGKLGQQVKAVFVPKTVVAPPAPVVLPPTPAVPVPPSEAERPPRSGQKTIALVVGGAGTGAIVVGTIFGLMAKSQYDGADCGGAYGTNICSIAGADARSSAKSKANISTALFTIGIVGVAAGAVLWLTAPSGHSHAPSVGVGPGTFFVRGAF